jgi:hypothetical protein
VKPDVVASNEALPFRDGTFTELFYDPPSVARGRGQFVGSSMEVRYGFWRKKADFDKNLQAVNAEFIRVLKPNGNLLFKWTQGSGSIRPLGFCLDHLSNFAVSTSASFPSKSGNKRTRVHFVVMRKRST